MASLLDLMSPEERAKAIARGEKRMQKKQGSTVSPELYIIAEFGYYFGWESILAIKRGYIEKIEIIHGKKEKVLEPFTLQEVLALLEAARKVWYSKLIETSHGSFVATNSNNSDSPGRAFNDGMETFRERADLNG